MRKVTGIFLCILLFMSMTLPVMAQEAKQVRISDVKDLLELAENCRLDSYSVDLTVSLEADIDLTGMVFSGIPIFSGTFLGNDHSISGLSISVSGSDQGFFRYLTQTAQVEKLHISGTVAPQGSRASIGGIAGSNAGTIQDCSFTGSVSGSEWVGGIAGRNTVSGIIEGCTVQGSVSGSHFIGGIAGSNSGTIRSCENAASVNTTPRQNSVELSQITLGTITGTESVGTATDIGGIAGSSSGTLRGCKNTGQVGYPHIGYNIGGIAGSQIGYLTACENYGTVSGRKDVGGITGHLEPSILLRYDKDTLQILEGQLQTLGKLTDRAAQNAGTNVQTIRGQLLQLENYTADAKAAIDVLTPNLGDPQIQDPDTYMAALQTLSASLMGMVQTQQSLQQSVADTGTALERDLQAIARQADVISATLGNGEQDLGASVRDVSDEDTEKDLTGKVEDSTNYGAVSGDLNIGGIVGAMALENDLDPEDDVDISGQFSLNAAGNLRCVVRDCTNLGPVTAKKYRAGGIIGWQAMGLVKDCSNTGAVESQQYAGGIAGQSYGYIRSCCVKAEIQAELAVGGIAGSGAVVTDCRSMAMLSGTECVGGILGAKEENRTDAAQSITGNYYLPVDADPGAIDGISYDTQAQPMELKAFMALEGLPELFAAVSISFVFEDGTSQSLTVAPGGTVDPADIPRIPEKQGCVGHWDMLDEGELTDLRFDMTFRAVYTAYGLTIASRETQGGKPVLLLQGDFAPDAAITIDEKVAPEWEEDLLGSLGFAVAGVGQPTRGRWLLPEDAEPGRLRLYVRNASGKWEEVSHTVEGSYVIFDLDPGDNAVALREAQSTTWIWILVGSLLLILLVGGILIAVGRKRKSRKQTEPAETPLT